MKKYSLILFLIVYNFSCKPPEAPAYKYEMSNFIELKKDPCFGFCPVYEIKINGTGEVVYNGKRNVEKEGTWYQKLTAEETNAIFMAFEQADFWGFKNEYTAQVTDLPTTWVTFMLGEKSKTIKDYYGAPESLKALEKMIEDLAESEENWKREMSID